MAKYKNPALCLICERKGTETCPNCKNFEKCSLMESYEKTDFFLLDRHFTIIQMIDKYCDIAENCEDCRARGFCELYVMPDIVKKASKIKRDKSLNFNKLPDNLTNNF